MSISRTNKSTLKPLSAIGAIAASMVLVFATAGTAHASVNVSPPAGTDYVNNEVVSVSGSTSAFPTATHVALAQCDVTGVAAPSNWGQRCELTTAKSLTAVSSGAYSFSGASAFTLKQSWSPNYDFTMGAPVNVGGSTSCATIGARDCAAVVSYYYAPNYPSGPITQLGAEKFDLTY